MFSLYRDSLATFKKGRLNVTELQTGSPNKRAFQLFDSITTLNFSMNQLFGETESLKTLQKVSSCHGKVEEEPKFRFQLKKSPG